MKKLLFLFAIAFTIFIFPLAAHATCTQYGTVVRVTAYADGVGTYHYIYVKTSPLSSINYYVKTSDDEMAEMASEALTNTTRVGIQGSATTCPTTGAYRSMGYLRYIIINP